MQIYEKVGELLATVLFRIFGIMKILILSCNTGEGHNSSANSLKKHFESVGAECEVADTLALVSETISKRVSDMYVFSTKSSLFENAYRLGGYVSDIGEDIGGGMLKSPVYLTNKLYANKLYNHITEGGFDAVVCVHLFPAEAISALKRRAKLDVPAIFVMTDYTCIPFLPETCLDKYVIAHEDLIEEYVEKGIPREKIVPIGIPVDEERFTARTERREARERACEIAGIENSDGRWFLVMSGSMGFGNLGGLIAELLDHTGEKDRIICVCGRNEKLKARLEAEFEGQQAFKAIGFTREVPLLMDACDVLFTKPGGITSTEAAVKNIPLVHTAPIPGLEDYNARFFHYHNMSYSTTDVTMQASVALRLASDRAYRERMLEAQRRNANPHTCQDIYELITNTITENEN